MCPKYNIYTSDSRGKSIVLVKIFELEDRVNMKKVILLSCLGKNNGNFNIRYLGTCINISLICVKTLKTYYMNVQYYCYIL